MLGTWQPTLVDRSPTESSPPASDSSTHGRFGSARARPTAAYRWRSNSLEVGTGTSNIPPHHVTDCANAQVIGRQPGGHRATQRRYRGPMTDVARLVTLDDIVAA